MSSEMKSTILMCCEQEGVIPLGDVYLWHINALLKDQETWGDEDEAKNVDYTIAPFWLDFANGQPLEPIYDSEDLKYYMDEYDLRITK